MPPAPPRTLVTGCAGFIGFHLATRLLRDGHEVFGLDSLDDPTEPPLQRARLLRLEGTAGFSFAQASVTDSDALRRLLEEARPGSVVHLAARVGVRASMVNPRAYSETNLVGFGNVLEACARVGIRHLVYASSSSVYGANRKVPFSEDDPVDHPVSYYAATKRANELQAHAFSHLYRLPTTGLRFFTVYGPFGRPDMAPILFARAILRGEAIRLFNGGRMQRDFTYVDDVVESVVRVLDRLPEGTGAEAPARILNVGSARPVELDEFVTALESHLGGKADRVLLPMQPGDLVATWADTRRLEALTGFSPRTALDEGLRRMAEWLLAFDRPVRT
ncbi:MAG TPA: NAD-dependent epimerase/dehydratase family protein [Anaeromyxobacter sp.]|nr:NAD-dependent epimerase/dehydratase family protein [Anaeromyxobacter sp.]